jgi:SAM-dependent methyltransferase
MKQKSFLKLFTRNVALNTSAFLIQNNDLKIRIMNLLNINHYSPQKIKNKKDTLIERPNTFISTFEKLKKKSANKYFKNKVCLEYGPGATLELAQLLMCYGAKRVVCYDIVPFYNKSASKYIRNEIVENYNTINFKNQYQNIDKVYVMSSDKYSKIQNHKDGIYYIYNQNAKFEMKESFDFICSKDVLEHVKDLKKIFSEMKYNLKTNGELFHLTNFTSHGIESKTPFDHLIYNNLVYSLMGSHRGIPNRFLWSYYLSIFKKINLKITKEYVDYKYSIQEINYSLKTRPKLRKYDMKDLEKKSIFFIAKK